MVGIDGKMRESADTLLTTFLSSSPTKHIISTQGNLEMSRVSSYLLPIHSVLAGFRQFPILLQKWKTNVSG